jgi:hypothetical protein
MIIQYGNYFISSGQDNKLYTLRQYVTKKIGEYTNDTNIYIKTLSSDIEKAIAKALEYVKDTGKNLELADFEVRPREKASTIDWTKFQAGKYRDSYYESVCDSDPNYVIFLLSKYGNSEKYKKTLDLCQSHPVIKNELDRILKEKEKQELERKKVFESNGHFYKNGEFVELSLTIVSIFSFQSFYGESFVVNLKDSEGKIFVFIGNSQLTGFNNKLDDSGFFKVTATIKHSNYAGVNQTHLKNPSIYVDKYAVIDENNKVILEVSLKEYKRSRKKVLDKVTQIKKQNPSSSLNLVSVCGGAYSLDY